MQTISTKRTRSSIFSFRRFQIDQTGCAMKVSSDATIFGGLIKTGDATHILDVGTGTGLLALMLAQRSVENSKIHAVELDPLAAQKAHQNVLSSPFSHKITVYNENILNFARRSSSTYQLIVCNPPFYEKATLSQNVRKRLAWHADIQSLDIDSLLQCVGDCLDNNGFFWVLLPREQGEKLKRRAEYVSLFPVKHIYIRHQVNMDPNRIVSCYQKSPAILPQPQTVEITRYDDSGAVSEEVQNILNDYMIYFPRLTQQKEP